MRGSLVLAALLASAFVLLLLPPPSAAQTITAQVQGPPALVPSQLAQYNITVSGWPEGVPVNYTVEYYITGANVSGGTPSKATPGRTTTTKSRFVVNVTAPTAEQTITLQVSVSAKGDTGPAENASAQTTIVVVKAIALSVTFHNASAVTALNVTVRWYVDNAYAGSSRVAQIAPLADTTVSFNYLPTALSAGQHTVRAEADLNGNGVIEPSQGEVAVSDFFYHNVQSPSTGWSYLLGVGVFFAVLLAVLIVRRRGQR